MNENDRTRTDNVRDALAAVLGNGVKVVRSTHVWNKLTLQHSAGTRTSAELRGIEAYNRTYRSIGNTRWRRGSSPSDNRVSRREEW